MKVNKLRDFAERTGWTFIQATAAAGLTALTTPSLSWTAAIKFVVTAGVLAALKVIVAQQAGSNGSGDAIPGGVEN